MKRKYQVMRAELRAMRSGMWMSRTGGINWTSPLWEPGEIRDLIHLCMRTL